MDNLHEIKFKAKELISIGTKSCLEYIGQLINPNSQKYNEFILIKANYFHNEKLFNLSLAEKKEINIDLSKNRLAILNFIDSIEEVDIPSLRESNITNSKSNNSFSAFLNDIEFYENPFDKSLKYLVRERYKTNLNYVEKLLRIQIREENPEISLLEYVDTENNYVFEYLAADNLIVSRKILITRLNGEASSLINCNPTTVDLANTKKNIPKLLKIEY
jgi:hypothetical protein